MSIFIKNVLFNEQSTNILIEGNVIKSIGANLTAPQGATILDGTDKAVFPTFANMHAHSAMTLFRGFGDDHDLGTWLNDWIFPNERNLDADIVYWGVKLACIEMIKSGTTAFSDMYFFVPEAGRAVEESGIRGLLSESNVDLHNPEMAKSVRKQAEAFAPVLEEWNATHELTKFTVSPHAIYTVSDETLKFFADYCVEHHVPYQMHMSETEKEVADCLAAHSCRPYEHLEQLGILEKMGPQFLGAHSLHLSDNEIAILGKYHCAVAHNPNSNLKLASGHAFRYQELRDAGVNVTLGTDGCASSNNLDMIEATKVMSLLQKGWRKDPVAMPASEALRVASRNGFQWFGVDAGEIAEGKIADLMLVDLNNLAFVPNNNTVSNLVYAAHGDAVDTVICNGRILMEHHHVEGEEEVIREARRVVKKLITVRPQA